MTPPSHRIQSLMEDGFYFSGDTLQELHGRVFLAETLEIMGQALTRIGHPAHATARRVSLQCAVAQGYMPAKILALQTPWGMLGVSDPGGDDPYRFHWGCDEVLTHCIPTDLVEDGWMEISASSRQKAMETTSSEGRELFLDVVLPTSSQAGALDTAIERLKGFWENELLRENTPPGTHVRKRRL